MKKLITFTLFLLIALFIAINSSFNAVNIVVFTGLFLFVREWFNDIKTGGSL